MFINVQKPLCVSLLLVAVSACGGGGGSSGVGAGAGAGGSDPVANFAELRQDFNVLADEITQIPFTDPRALPSTGAATYNGLLGVETGDGILIGGQMRLNANFGSNSIDGDVRNIIDSQDNRYAGALQITDGGIDRTANTEAEYTFGAFLGGNLSQGGDTFNVDAAINGDFVGDNYQGVEGIVFGSVAGPDGSTPINGEFYGKR